MVIHSSVLLAFLDFFSELKSSSNSREVGREDKTKIAASDVYNFKPFTSH